MDVAPHPYRIPEWYLALAPQVDINIIVSTGFYLERRTPLKFHAVYREPDGRALLGGIDRGYPGQHASRRV